LRKQRSPPAFEDRAVAQRDQHYFGIGLGPRSVEAIGSKQSI